MTKIEFRSWLECARPKTLPASLSPVILALALTQKPIHWPIAIATGLCALLLQVASNMINDYYDGVSGADSSERLGPTRAVASGALSAKSVKKGFIIALSCAFLIGLYLMVHGGAPIVIIGLSSIFFCWAYTGGPYPLSYFALGEVFAFAFFGPIALWGAAYLQNPNIDHQVIISFGHVMGLISACLMGINNLRDINSDRAAKKTTLATIFGPKKMRTLLLAFIALSQFQAIVLLWKYSQIYCYLPVIALILKFRLITDLKGNATDRALNLTLARCGQYFFLMSLTMSAAIILSRL